MVNMNYDIPHVFSACEAQCGKNPAMCAQHGDIADSCNPYARLYVVSQSYNNLAKPAHALKNGTIFNDLYMPYRPAGCEVRREKGGN